MKKKQEKKETEGEQIMRVVKEGFDGVAWSFDEAKADLLAVEQHLTRRIDILENRILTEHTTRLEILEDDMRRVKTKLKIQ